MSKDAVQDLTDDFARFWLKEERTYKQTKMATETFHDGSYGTSPDCATLYSSASSGHSSLSTSPWPTEFTSSDDDNQKNSSFEDAAEDQPYARYTFDAEDNRKILESFQTLKVTDTEEFGRKMPPAFVNFPSISPFWSRQLPSRTMDFFTNPCQTMTYPLTEAITFVIESTTQGLFNFPDPEALIVQVFNPSGDHCEVSIQLHNNNQRPHYICIFRSSEEGVYTGSVKIRLGGGDTCDITGSPFKLFISRRFEQANIQVVTQIPPKEIVNQKDQFDRHSTWGIDVDPVSDLIYLVDKVDHLVRIFTADGIQLLDPSSNQNRIQSELNKPTGIAVDRVNNRLIVSDKDNHRICFFTLDGKFIRSFGKLGQQDGKFLFPWGVAVSPNGNLIAVADSRNHRLQLFDKFGNFLRKFSILETDPFVFRQEFNSPRGVCFDNNGENIFVTDYKINAVFSFDKNLTQKQTLVPSNRVVKPQGLTVDQLGNVVICESFNNCIRNVTPDGVLLRTIDGTDQRKKNFSGPQDVAFFRNGLLALVDRTGTVCVL